MKKALLIIAIGMVALSMQAQVITTVAGNGTGGYTGDNGLATSAELNGSAGVALDAAGNMYIAEYLNNTIRKVAAGTGIITTVAGTGTQGNTGDGFAATSAKLFHSCGVAVDTAGNIYIADGGNNKIRKVTKSTGIITTVAGNGTAGYTSDGIAATSAELSNPYSVAVDINGNIYIADYGNHRVRKVTASTGLISTVAGTGTGGYSADGVAANTSKLNNPIGVALDAAGNIYISDFANSRIRMVTASSGLISTVAGTGTAGFVGDGTTATTAEISKPTGLTVDAAGNIYFAGYDYRVRKVTASTGILSTLAGNGIGSYLGDGSCAVSSELYYPFGVAVDAAGDVFIGDQSNNRVRKITSFSITSQPISTTVCSLTNASFTVAAAGVASYHWQVNTGSGFTNIINTGVYSGDSTATLHITGATASMNGYTYQCVLTSCTPVNSGIATLTVNPSPVFTTSVSSATITANQAGATYQWLNCGTGNSPISGATNQSYTALADGNYSVIVTMGTCFDTSACVAIVNLGMNELADNATVTVYPNPFTDQTTISFSEEQKNTTITITDLVGKIIYTNKANDTKQINVTLDTAPGIYFVSIVSEGKKRVLKLIKE